MKDEMTLARRSRFVFRNARRATAFTLLEIILALSILAGGLAIITEVVRIAQHNHRIARDLTYAQMLCEGKMNEVAVGIAPLEPAADVPFGAPYDGWAYAVEVGETEIAGLHAVTVTVYQDPAPKIWPVQFSLVRVIGDPPSAAATDNSGDSSTGSSSSQNSGNASGTSSGTASGGTGS